MTDRHIPSRESYTFSCTFENMDYGLLNLMTGLNEDGSVPDGWEWEDIPKDDPDYNEQWSTQRLVRKEET